MVHLGALLLHGLTLFPFGRPNTPTIVRNKFVSPPNWGREGKGGGGGVWKNMIKLYNKMAWASDQTMDYFEIS
jgi:hypothetical protein